MAAKDDDELATLRGRFRATGLEGAAWAFACLPVALVVGWLTSARVGLIAYLAVVIGGMIAFGLWAFRDELREWWERRSPRA